MFKGVFQRISDILLVVLNTLSGLLSVFIGVFTGDWQGAWDGVKQIFTGIWDFINRKIKKQVPVAAARYKEELFLEINRDREEHGKPPFKDDGNQSSEEKEITASTTDPDNGMFCKDEHKRCFACKAHTACDDHGFVLDVVVTEGNVHDSVAFHPLYDRLTDRYAQMQVVIADAAYKTPYICKRIFDDKRDISTAYKRPQTMNGGHEWYKYVYDAYYDCVICPEYHTLHYTTTNRNGYREYKSRRYVCRDCPTRNKCTHSKLCEKTVLLHVWRNYVELAEEVRYIPKYKALYEKRKEKIERVFVDAKEKHGMRYTLYRGLSAVSKWVRLKFAAMNLKKLASWLWDKGPSPNFFLLFVRSYTTKNQSVSLGLVFSTGWDRFILNRSLVNFTWFPMRSSRTGCCRGWHRIRLLPRARREFPVPLCLRPSSPGLCRRP